MKYILLFAFLVLYCSCTQKRIVPKEVESLIIADAKKNNLSFLQKIEIIPLETDTNSLIKNVDKFQYIKELNAFMILDSRQFVFLFDSKGRLISNSSKKWGEGPTDYYMAVDVDYNPYSKTIDLLNPNALGEIISYDTTFQWKGKHKLDQQISSISFAAIGDKKYALMPAIYKNELDYFYTSLYNYASGEEASVQNAGFDGYVSRPFLGNTVHYFRLDSGVYFTPRCIDYNFYKIDTEKSKLDPMLRLDFGADNITAKMLAEKFGIADGNSKLEKSAKSNINIMIEKDEYLMGSDYPIPIIRLLSDRYVYVYVLTNHKPNHYIYNRNTGEGYYLTKDFDFQLRFGLWLDGNVMYSFIEPHEIEKYINKDYMSEETIHMVENLKEDDNPVIIKYYFK